MHCKELAFDTGRKWQSEETGFMHHSYRSDSLQTIPTSENFSFVLALLRSRLGDNIQEAKGLLNKFLSYQVDGNFPIYLHEFPILYDRWRAVEVLPAMIWIAKGFHHVIGEELKKKLEEGIKTAVEHTLSALKEHSASYLQTVRIGCSVKSAGKYLEDANFLSVGEALIKQVEELGVQPSWFVAEQLGHLLASLNLDTIWPTLWQHCQGVYYHPLSVYCGPHLAEKYSHQAPAPTLLDLYLNEESSVSELDPIFVHGALVHPFEEPPVEQQSFEGTLAGQRWEIVKTEDYVCSLIDQNEALDGADKKVFSPLFMAWGERHAPHTLVAQGGNVVESTFRITGNEIEFLMQLGDEVENDHPKDRAEIALFCSRANTQISIDGKRATLFRLGEKVRIHSSVDAVLEFSLQEGEGDFTGHLSVGNRPSQMAANGEAYDWKIVFRSVRRSNSCVVKVKLSIDA